MNLIINFNLNGAILTCLGADVVTTGIRNTAICNFTFTEHWDGLIKNAIFYRENEQNIVVQIDDNNQCEIQSDYISKGYIKIGVVGTSTDKTLPSTVLEVYNIKTGATKDGVQPVIPVPDLWEQYLLQVTELKNLAKESADEATKQAGISTDNAIISTNKSIIATEKANDTSILKDQTASIKSEVNVTANQVAQDKQTVANNLTESQQILEEQKRLIGGMPSYYIVSTLEEMNTIVNPKVKDFCFVLGATQAVYMYYTTAIDGSPLVNPTWVWVSDIQMVTPTKDYLLNILQLAKVATSGSYNDLINQPSRYESFMTVTDGIWDYSKTDKIILTSDLVSINNVENGSVGVIQSLIDITLPANSKKAFDYDFMDISGTEKYSYTFIYDGINFYWSRTVIA